MQKIRLALLAAAALVAGMASFGVAQAAPAGGPVALGTASGELNMVQDAQFIFGGHNYCFYIDGWHGPGWYWCGYRHRRGYGWGGGEGFHGWHRGGPAHVYHPHGAPHGHPHGHPHHP
jgi:hypothetical protein